jgi:hypothetical protein
MVFLMVLPWWSRLGVLFLGNTPLVPATIRNSTMPQKTPVIWEILYIKREMRVGVTAVTGGAALFLFVLGGPPVTAVTPSVDFGGIPMLCASCGETTTSSTPPETAS